MLRRCVRLPCDERFSGCTGHRRAVTIAGSEPGTAPAVLLVHGIGDSSRTRTEVVPLLAERRTVIAPDLLGHGGSDKPRADYSIGGFAWWWAARGISRTARTRPGS